MFLLLNSVMESTDLLAVTFNTLLANGLTFSQYDFSRRWLGMSRSYFSCCKATERKASVEALSKLCLRLEREAASIKRIPSFPFSSSLNQRCSVLNELREQVLDELRATCLPTG